MSESLCSPNRHSGLGLQHAFRICYEGVVEDLEGNVQRILEFCGLEFEPDCVQFYKRERSVRTASAEHVHQPIFREGLHQWRNYEPWLGPLNAALDDALIRYLKRHRPQ